MYHATYYVSSTFLLFIRLMRTFYNPRGRGYRWRPPRRGPPAFHTKPGGQL